MDQAQKDKVIKAVNLASSNWKNAFNSGNGRDCAAQYEADAVMHARPFGTFTGTEEIAGFWEQLIADGFTGVEYVEPELEVVDEQSAILKSGWKMNKAGGVIHRELWVLQEDGRALLREDDFEAIS